MGVGRGKRGSRENRQRVFVDCYVSVRGRCCQAMGGVAWSFGGGGDIARFCVDVLWKGV